MSKKNIYETKILKKSDFLFGNKLKLKHKYAHENDSSGSYLKYSSTLYQKSEFELNLVSQ